MYQYYLQAKLVPKGLQPKLRPAIEPVGKSFFSKWNENITNLAFLQLHLLEDECKKKLVSLNKTKVDLSGQLKGLGDCNTFNLLMNFTAKIVSNLKCKLHAKNLTCKRLENMKRFKRLNNALSNGLPHLHPNCRRRRLTARMRSKHRKKPARPCPHQPESHNTFRKSTSPPNSIYWKQFSKRHKSTKT